MEYLNIIISILIFIIIMVIFYWIISNFGIGGNSNTKPNSDINLNTEKKIAMLKNELANIKNELNIRVAAQSEQNLNKDAYDQAAGAISGGDLFTSKVFWDKN